MGNAVTIDSLEIELNTKADGASKGLNGLKNTLGKLGNTTSRASGSMLKFGAKLTAAFASVKKVSSFLGSAIKKSADYTENLNLFTVAMGEYAKEAKAYAEQVGEIMGIDPGEWMRAQGVFMTLTKGFGVAGDRASIMSKNLTQLGYDLSSFYNISTNDAMLKLQSGISGELEPLRRLGYDLSQAKLEATALKLGITKTVSAMTQAEKSQLRYYAIMTQVTDAQGDMARTLDDPANQMRILKSQIEQTGRAIGNIFIPALNKVLPYVTATFRVIRAIADVIAGLVGFKFPEIDDSKIKDMASSADDASTNLDDTTDAVKKLKKYTMGFDELNVIDISSDELDGLSSMGEQFNFELPEYDFLGDATQSKVSEIVEDMKEWLGITGEITSWSDFFHTKLGKILFTVGAIKIAMAGWKIASSVLSFFSMFGGKVTGVGGAGVGAVLSPKNFAKGVFDIAIVVSGVVALLGILGAMKDEFPDMEDTLDKGVSVIKKAFSFVTDVGVEIGAVAAACAILGSIGVKKVAGGFADLALIVDGVPVLVTALGAFMSIDNFSEFASTGIDEITKVFEGLADIALEIGIVSGIVVGLGIASPGTVASGFAGLAVIVGGMEVLLVALGALDQIPGFSWLTEAGGQVLIDLATVIGEFAGAIIGGFAGGLSVGLPMIGENLGLFAENAQPFFKGIDSNSLDAVTNLALAIMAITAAEFLDAISSFVSFFTGENTLETFGMELVAFADQYVIFADKVSGVDHGVVEASANAGKALAAFAQEIPNEGGLLAKLTGENNIGEWGKSLVSFAEDFVKYADLVKDVDVAVVDASSAAAKSLAEFAQEIPNEGGLIAKLTGENNIGEWGKSLVSFGEDFAKYSDYVKDVDVDVVNKSTAAAKSVAAFAHEIPNDGGVASWFAGENNIGEWGESLRKFGTQFAIYSDRVKGVDTSVVDASTNAAKSIVAFADNIPNEGGVASWFAGDNAIDDWGLSLAQFGASFKAYYGHIKNVKTDVIDKTTSSIKAIIAFAEMIPDQAWYDDDVLEEFGEELEDFGECISGYSEYIKTVDISKMDSVTKHMGDLLTTMGLPSNEFDFTNLTNLTNAFESLGKAVTSFDMTTVQNSFKKMLNGLIKTYETFLNNIRSEASSLFSNISSGDKSNFSKKITIPKFETYADGGFPTTGEMFVAREAGAEMVGRIGRRTAVVNNEQIVEGIASGVSVANSESNALLREQNSLLRGILAKETGVYIDGKHISDSVDKYKRERGRVVVTGGAY